MCKPPLNTAVSLPGARRRICEGKKRCENHPERSAKYVVQGETDSQGAELFYLCDECLKRLDEEEKLPRPGTCDFCRDPKPDLRPMRNTLDEGIGGPVYQVCEGCRRTYRQEANRQLQEWARWDPDYDDWSNRH